jgi:hypothetical protein
MVTAQIGGVPIIKINRLFPEPSTEARLVAPNSRLVDDLAGCSARGQFGGLGLRVKVIVKLPVTLPDKHALLAQGGRVICRISINIRQMRNPTSRVDHAARRRLPC